MHHQKQVAKYGHGHYKYSQSFPWMNFLNSSFIDFNKPFIIFYVTRNQVAVYKRSKFFAIIMHYTITIMVIKRPNSIFKYPKVHAVFTSYHIITSLIEDRKIINIINCICIATLNQPHIACYIATFNNAPRAQRHSYPTMLIYHTIVRPQSSNGTTTTKSS